MSCTRENGWKRPFDVRDDQAVLATFAADFAGDHLRLTAWAFKRIRVRLVGSEGA
jgi:hypothetical protein